jgi:hypothetical protein
MPIIKTVKLFKFNELSIDTQEKVLEKHREINVDYDWWDMVISNKREEIRETYGIDIGNKVYFDIERSRDIYCKDILLLDDEKFHDKLIEDIKKDEPNEYLRRQIKGENLKADLNRYVAFFFDKSGECSILDVADIESDAELREVMNRYKILRNIDGYFMNNIIRPIYNDLRDYINYAYSDEAVKETIDCNDWSFLENGTILNEYELGTAQMTIKG